MRGLEIKSDNEFDKLRCMKAYSADAKVYCGIFEKYIFIQKISTNEGILQKMLFIHISI